MATTDEVLCLGNAIMDCVKLVDDELIERSGLRKGAMTLIDEAQLVELDRLLAGYSTVSGGSAANTAAGIASLGGRPVLLGTVGCDALGRRYAEDLSSVGVRCALATDEVRPTGRCYVLVSPDAQRTMATHLGAASALDPVQLEAQWMRRPAVVYLEGYLLDAPLAADALAWLEAHLGGEAVDGPVLALSASDHFVVQRHRGALLSLAARAELLFANEVEAIELTGAASPKDAARALGRSGTTVLVTRGAQGSLVVDDGELFEIPAVAVERVIDTTGAGDCFAAGVLAGIVAGLGTKEAATLGSACAADVVAHLGARPTTALSGLREALEAKR